MSGSMLMDALQQFSAAAVTQSQISHLAASMRDMPQLDVETTHTHAPGIYVRTIHLPAGATLVGKVHATEHMFVLSEGTLLVATEHGVVELHAPYQAVCEAGTQRAGHCLTDVVCSNVHINPTNETDMVRLEEMLITPTLEVAPWPG